MEETIAVEFDLEPGVANLWAVVASMPCERALLDAWVLCVGVEDRLRLAATGAPLYGDVARSQTFAAVSAQALFDASLPAYAGNRAVTRLLLDATTALETVVTALIDAEEGAWAAVEGVLAVDLADRARNAAAAALAARDLVQMRVCCAETGIGRGEGLRPAA